MKFFFISYNKHSKGYVFISEHEDGIVIDLESRCAIFLEENFPHTCGIYKNLHLYEMMDLNIRSTLELQLMIESSGSKLVLITSKIRE